MTKLADFLSKFKGVTHFIAIGVGSAAAYLAAHPEDAKLFAQFAANHGWVWAPVVLTVLTGLYHNPTK